MCSYTCYLYLIHILREVQCFGRLLGPEVSVVLLMPMFCGTNKLFCTVSYGALVLLAATCAGGVVVLCRPTRRSAGSIYAQTYAQTVCTPLAGCGAICKLGILLANMPRASGQMTVGPCADAPTGEPLRAVIQSSALRWCSALAVRLPALQTRRGGPFERIPCP